MTVKIIMPRRDPQSFDAFAAAYDDFMSQERNYNSILQRNHDFIHANLPPYRNAVLDVGCGTGILARELSVRFASVLALDLSEPMLAIARRKRSAANLEYCQADANELVLTRKFDAIVSQFAFHHLTRLPDTLAVLKTALAPGGRLIIIDCLSLGLRIPRWTISFYAYAGLLLFPNLVRRGFPAAWTHFRFITSPAWIAHIKSDRFLTSTQFRELYGRALPGAQFTKLGHCMGVVWTAP